MLSANQSDSRSRSRTLLQTCMTHSTGCYRNSCVHNAITCQLGRKSHHSILPFPWVLTVSDHICQTHIWMRIMYNALGCGTIADLLVKNIVLYFRIGSHQEQQKSSGKTTECLNLSGNRGGMKKKKKHTKTTPVSKKQCCIFIYPSHIYFVRICIQNLTNSVMLPHVWM